MIEIFKTNVQTTTESVAVMEHLSRQFPNYSINFDLEDCDRILRIEADEVVCGTVSECVSKLGFSCIALE